MTHLALLSPEMEAGGAQRVVSVLARGFAARGHRVDLVLLRAEGPLLNELPPTVRVVDLAGPSSILGNIGFAVGSVWRLAAWLRRERPDAMLSTIGGANLVALLARRFAGVRLQLALRETASLAGFISPWRYWGMRVLYRQADMVITLSPTMTRDLIRRTGFPAARVQQIPNPVDVEFVRERSVEALTHPWLDSGEVRVVVAVGRLVPQKAYDTLLRAFTRLPPTTPVRLIIIGEGPERRRLEELADRLGIADCVQLVGFDPNPWRWMARADLFVLCSRSEGMPNSVLEARVLGLPIVITEYDEGARLVGGPGATLASVDDPESLAGAIATGLTRTREPPSPLEATLDPMAAYEKALCIGPT